jgi:hypothetical protein
VQRLAAGQAPGARAAIQAGLDIFRPMLWPVAIAIGAVGASAALAVGLALEVDEALGALVLVPLFLYLRWYFVPQAVVAGKARGLEALRASWKLTGGRVLRVAGVLIVAALLLGIAGQVVAVPLLAFAQGADSGPLFVLYGAFAQALATPAVAIVGVLLYFDLRARS